MGSAPIRDRSWSVPILEAAYVRPMRALRSVRRLLLPVAHCNVGGIPIRIRITSESEHHRAETYATKEPETLDWLRGRLRDGDVFFDVGANIGLYSIFAAKLRPSCRVFAFEPQSANFTSLCRNILLNGAANVTPCGFPLSDREGLDLFHVYDLQPGSSLHSLGGPSAFRREPASVTQGVLGTTLDALVGRHGLPAPSLLKLDVDGIEERILEGGSTLLESPALRSILVEVTSAPGAESSWAERKLAGRGYGLEGRSDWTLEVGGLESRNLIFDRRTRPGEEGGTGS